MDNALSAKLQDDAINLIRGFAMDAPLHAKSGHQGTAMALAPLAHVLFSRVMKFDPAAPEWPDRDRFVLSNGHASILQYSMLYLTGLGLELDDIKAFRSWESTTPGHPEAGHTTGVEVTTGPARAGLRRRRRHGHRRAGAARPLRPRPRRPPHVRDRRRRLLHGGHQPRGRLAGRSSRSRSADLHLRRQPHHDRRPDLARLLRRRRRCASPPTAGTSSGWARSPTTSTRSRRRCSRRERTRRVRRCSILRSHVGYPSPDHTDDHLAHGNPFTPEDVTRTKAVMGIPDEPFWAPTEVVDAYRAMARARCREQRQRWEETLDELSTEERAAWDAAWAGTGLKGWEEALPVFEQGEETGHPPGDGQGAGRRHGSLPRARRRRRRPDRQHRRQAARRRRHADRRLTRRPPAATTASGSTRWVRRSSGWPATEASSRSAARSSPSSTTCASPCGSPRCHTPRPCSCSATTPSVSARTARRTSRSSSWHRSARCPSCRSSAPPTATRRRPHGGPPSTTTVRPCSC